jgi:hypothetical protein
MVITSYNNLISKRTEMLISGALKETGLHELAEWKQNGKYFATLP